MRRIRKIGYAPLLLLAAATGSVRAAPIEMLPPVAAAGGAEPHLAVADDGQVVLSWLEPHGKGVALRYSTLDEDEWNPPKTLARGDNWFVNWADFPSVVPIRGDLWAAHWLERRPGGIYSYDIAVAVSNDGGDSWSAAITPHTDGTPTEHGFVSLFPWQDGVGALWLDGRNTASNAASHDEHAHAGGMTLRSAVITPAADLTAGQLADELVCDCCQTDVAVGASGPIAVYRNRTPDEIRDVYVTRATGGIWEPGRAVADDGWEIAGCPVNGPSIAADENDVAVAWFTAADDVTRVKVAFSGDAAASFGTAIDVETGQTLGRVAVLLLDGGDAVVGSLHDGADGTAEVRMRRVSPGGDVGPAIRIATTSRGRLSGFPQLAKQGNRIVAAWTDAGDGDTTIRSAIIDGSLLDTR